MHVRTEYVLLRDEVLRNMWKQMPSAISSILHAYRVGPANFSRRKTGHAHDNSADSENLAGAREPNVHVHFIFRFENGQGNQSFFLSMNKIQLKRVNPKLSRQTNDAHWSGSARGASSGP